MNKEPLLDPFEPHMLSAIRAAVQASWSELPRDECGHVARVRNRLVGTIANLALKGVLDPHELKQRALDAVGMPAPVLVGDTGNATITRTFSLACKRRVA
jgi:hypothetical protein